ARSLIHRPLPPRMKREDFTFVHSLRVRWAEVDRQDVVFNGHYFLYFDVAVAEYWRAIGFRYPEDIVEKFGTDIYAVKASAEDHPASVAGEIFVVHLVQFFPQQRQRKPHEQRVAALDVAPDRERRRLDPVHQQIVHQLHVGTDSPRDVLVLEEDEGRSFHRGIELAQRMAAAEAGIEGRALGRIALEEIGNEQQRSGLQDRLEDRQGS